MDRLKQVLIDLGFRDYELLRPEDSLANLKDVIETAYAFVLLEGNADREFVNNWLRNYRAARSTSSPRSRRWCTRRRRGRTRRAHRMCIWIGLHRFMPPRSSRRRASKRSCADVRRDVMLAERNPYPDCASSSGTTSMSSSGGRVLIDGMLARLRDTQFLAVLGASGTGKSSRSRGVAFGARDGADRGRGIALAGELSCGPGGRAALVASSRVLVASVLVASGETGARPCDVRNRGRGAAQASSAGRGPRRWSRGRAELAEEENLLIVADQFEPLLQVARLARAGRGGVLRDAAAFESARAVEGRISSPSPCARSISGRAR